MTDIAETEPLEIQAGDTIQWKKYLDDYPPATWTLSYVLLKDGQFIEITASNNGDGWHLVSVAMATSKSWVAGNYSWFAYVTDGSERYQVDSGKVEIKPNYANLKGGFDDRTHVAKTYEALKAVVEGKATQDQMEYSLPSGRSLSRMSWTEILKAYHEFKMLYAQEVKAERLANGLGHNGKIQVRF